MNMDPTAGIVAISVAGPIVGSAIGISRRPSFSYICNMLCFRCRRNAGDFVSGTYSRKALNCHHH